MILVVISNCCVPAGSGTLGSGLRNSCDGFAYSIDAKEDHMDSLRSHLGLSILDGEQAVLFRLFALCQREAMVCAGCFAALACSAPRTVSRIAVKSLLRLNA